MSQNIGFKSLWENGSRQLIIMAKIPLVIFQGTGRKNQYGGLFRNFFDIGCYKFKRGLRGMRFGEGIDEVVWG